MLTIPVKLHLILKVQVITLNSRSIIVCGRTFVQTSHVDIFNFHIQKTEYTNYIYIKITTMQIEIKYLFAIYCCFNVQKKREKEKFFLDI